MELSMKKIVSNILREKASLTTNFSSQKLLVTMITNLDINLKNKKLLVPKTVIIMNKKL